MVAHQSLCSEAKIYYYDYLDSENHDEIPEPILAHLRTCGHCGDFIAELDEQRQSGAGQDEANEQDREIIERLGHHFAYLDKPVSCKVARPFLPLMAVAGGYPAVPTPVTVHVDHCESCRVAFETLAGFRLENDQAEKLSQLMVFKEAARQFPCESAEKYVRAFAACRFLEIPVEFLQHVTACPACRGLVQAERKMLMRREAENRKERSAWFPCHQLRPCDIFDYVVPMRYFPRQDKEQSFRETLLEHLRQCPACLERVMRFHREVYEIIDADANRLTTVCRSDDTKEDGADKDAKTGYEGWPLAVEVREEAAAARAAREDVSGGQNDVCETGKRKKLHPLKNPLTHVAIAACLFAGFFLFIYSPAVTAFKPDKLPAIVRQESLIQIRHYSLSPKELEREVIIARNGDKVRLTEEVEGERFIWDMAGQTYAHRDLVSREATVEKMKTRHIRHFLEKLEQVTVHLGDWTDGNLSEDGWRRIEDSEPSAEGCGEVIYEKTMITDSNPDTIRSKWRLYYNSKQNRPVQLEEYTQLPGQTAYRSTRLITYRFGE